jgi:ankyrin repeat protein
MFVKNGETWLWVSEARSMLQQQDMALGAAHLQIRSQAQAVGRSQASGINPAKALRAIQMLIESKMDLNTLDAQGHSPLHIATQAESVEAVAALLDRKVDPNLKTQEGLTALMIAAQKGHLKLVMTLIEKGANPLLTTTEGDSALTFAERVEPKQPALVEFLKVATQRARIREQAQQKPSQET